MTTITSAFPFVISDVLTTSLGLAGILYPTLTSFGPLGDFFGSHFRRGLALLMLLISVAFIFVGLWGILLTLLPIDIHEAPKVRRHQQTATWLLAISLGFGSLFDLLLGSDLLTSNQNSLTARSIKRIWDYKHEHHQLSSIHAVEEKLNCTGFEQCWKPLLRYGGGHLVRHGAVGLLATLALFTILYMARLKESARTSEYEPLLAR
jgi:hypothetical protein